MNTNATTAARKAAAARAREIACCAAYDAAHAARRGDDQAAQRHAGIAQAAVDNAPAGMADTRHAASFAAEAARWHGRNEHTRQIARGDRLEVEAAVARRQEQAATADDWTRFLSNERNNAVDRGMPEGAWNEAQAVLAEAAASSTSSTKAAQARKEARPVTKAAAVAHPLFSGHRWTTTPHDTARKSNTRFPLSWA